MGIRSDRLAWTRFVECGEDKKPQRNKFNAQRTEANGVTYDSEQEARRALELEWLLSIGEIADLRRQVSFELIPKQGKKLKAVNYRADFVYVDVKTGRQVVEDVKGAKTPVFEIKRKLMLFRLGIEVVEIRYPKKPSARRARSARSAGRGRRRT